MLMPMFTSRGRFGLLVVGAVVLAVGCLATVSASPGAAERPWGKEVLRLTAKGVQTYQCEAGSDGKLIWKFTGPKADLFDTKGGQVGTHYAREASPMWEIKGHTVAGTKVRQRASTTTGAIPELQLAAKPGAGEGAFKDVTFIERLNTVGGALPAIDATSKDGDKAEVPYSAEYVFYAMGP